MRQEELQTGIACWHLAAKCAGYFPTPQSAALLMLGTCAHESDGFKTRRQYGFSQESSGGAFGLSQVQLNSLSDSIHYAKRINVAAACNAFLSPAEYAVWRLENPVQIARAMMKPSGDGLAILACRLHYLQRRGAIPTFDGKNPVQLLAQADYYVKQYNCGGAATARKYIDHWHAWAVPVLRAVGYML